MIKQSKLLKIKSQILSNLFNEKYGLRLGEFKNTTGTERVNRIHWQKPELANDNGERAKEGEGLGNGIQLSLKELFNHVSWDFIQEPNTFG